MCKRLENSSIIDWCESGILMRLLGLVKVILTLKLLLHVETFSSVKLVRNGVAKHVSAGVAP